MKGLIDRSYRCLFDRCRNRQVRILQPKKVKSQEPRTSLSLQSSEGQYLIAEELDNIARGTSPIGDYVQELGSRW